MLSFVIDQLKQEGSSLDADLSELHGVKLRLPNVPLPQADLSELQGVKLPEVPQIAREADMDMDIIQKLLDADQDIDDGKFLLLQYVGPQLTRYSLTRVGDDLCVRWVITRVPLTRGPSVFAESVYYKEGKKYGTFWSLSKV